MRTHTGCRLKSAFAHCTALHSSRANVMDWSQLRSDHAGAGATRAATAWRAGAATATLLLLPPRSLSRAATERGASARRATLAARCRSAGARAAAAPGAAAATGGDTRGGSGDAACTGRGIATRRVFGAGTCSGTRAMRVASGATGRNASASRPAPTTTAAAQAVTRTRAAWRTRVRRRGAAASVPCCLSIADDGRACGPASL